MSDAKRDAAEVKIRVKEENVQGAKKVADGIDDITGKAKKAVPALLLLTQTFGESDGIMAKTVRSISRVASALAAFGPAGGVVAAAKAGMDLIARHFIEKTEKMLERAKEFGAAMTKRLDRLKELRLTHLANDLERVAAAAAKAERRLDAAAEVDAKFRATGLAAAGAREEGELAGMRHAMAVDVAAAAETDKDAVGAEWRLRIAEREAEIRNAAADREREAAKERLADEEHRLALAEANAKKLQDAADEAGRKFREAFDVASETDPQWVAKMKQLAERAAMAADAAWEAADRRREAVWAARDEEDVAEIRRQNEIRSSNFAREEAALARDRAESDRLQALSAADAERNRNAGAAEAPAAVPARMPFFGGGDPAFGAGGEYERRARELGARFRDVSARRDAYRRSRYRARQAAWNFAHPDGRLSLMERAGAVDPYEAWNRSIEDANGRWGDQLKSLREQRRQLDDMYGQGALGGPGSAAERTAAACEGILRHFEGGRFD